LNRLRHIIFLALAPGAVLVSQAEVADSSANGFTIKFSVNVQAPPADVYWKLVHNVGDWWNAEHTFSRNAHNLSIDDKVGGCFCEKLPDAGGVRHFELINVAPGKQLVLSGAMGPLQALAAAGTMTIRFISAEGGTKLDVVYTVTGYFAAGMNTWAMPVDTVVREQFDRLKNYVEHGDPGQKK
jgi:uncharacterized protein YndB with AHSA1/START domain